MKAMPATDNPQLMLDHARKMADLWQAELSKIGTSFPQNGEQQQGEDTSQTALYADMMAHLIAHLTAASQLNLDAIANIKEHSDDGGQQQSAATSKDQAQSDGAASVDLSLHECTSLCLQLAARLHRLERRVEALEDKQQA
ncbi:MAG: hypothetical protein AB8B77_08225 [Alphaproteobacteria bacterium]